MEEFSDLKDEILDAALLLGVQVRVERTSRHWDKHGGQNLEVAGFHVDIASPVVFFLKPVFGAPIDVYFARSEFRIAPKTNDEIRAERRL